MLAFLEAYITPENRTIQLATELCPCSWPLLFSFSSVTADVRLRRSGCEISMPEREIHASFLCVCVCVCVPINVHADFWPLVKLCDLDLLAGVSYSANGGDDTCHRCVSAFPHTTSLYPQHSPLWNQYYHYPLLETKKPRHRKVKKLAQGTVLKHRTGILAQASWPWSLL